MAEQNSERRMKTRTALLFACLLGGLLTACNHKPAVTPPVVEPEPDTLVVVEPPATHLTLLFAGDLMFHDSQVKRALQPDGTYDFSGYFTDISDEVKRADVAIINLETTLSGPPYTGYPTFRSPDAVLQATLDAGFDVFLTANNHCLDGGSRGFERTLSVMDSLLVPHLGTYRDTLERDQYYPFLIEQNGIRVVLLNFTYGTNGLKPKGTNVVNYMDTVQIANDIEKAHSMHPDVIIALPHWGYEYHPLPSAKQKEMAQWLLDKGVDHIIGGHPHVAQPLELNADSSHLVAWSMGNVVSNMTRLAALGGYMVRMELTKRDSTTRLSDCGYTLYWMSRPDDNNFSYQHRVMRFSTPDSLLTAREIGKRDAIDTLLHKLLDTHNQGPIKEYEME